MNDASPWISTILSRFYWDVVSWPSWQENSTCDAKSMYSNDGTASPSTRQLSAGFDVLAPCTQYIPMYMMPGPSLSSFDLSNPGHWRKYVPKFVCKQHILAYPEIAWCSPSVCKLCISNMISHDGCFEFHLPSNLMRYLIRDYGISPNLSNKWKSQKPKNNKENRNPTWLGPLKNNLKMDIHDPRAGRLLAPLGNAYKCNRHER